MGTGSRPKGAVVLIVVARRCGGTVNSMTGIVFSHSAGIDENYRPCLLWRACMLPYRTLVRGRIRKDRTNGRTFRVFSIASEGAVVYASSARSGRQGWVGGFRGWSLLMLARTGCSWCCSASL